MSGAICVQAETNRFNGLTSGFKNVWMKHSMGKSARKGSVVVSVTVGDQ